MRMELKQKNGLALIKILAFCALLSTCSAVVADTSCNPDSNDASTGGAAVCTAVNVNAECPAGKDKCACKDGYKAGSPNTNTCVLKEIADFSCDPSNDHGTTGGAAICKAVDANAECPDGERSCKCKSGYKQHETVVNSCAKVITATACTSGNGGGTTCHDIDSNAECPTDGTHCACKADYFLNSGKTTCVKKITSVDCVPGVAGTATCKLVDENSDCPADGDNCACKEGYSGTDSCAKDAGSSATSAWMTTSLFVTAVLVYLPRLICG